MSKSIKITAKVFGLILKYQGPRETYSAVIERAFTGFEALDEASKIFQGLPHIPERPEVEVK